MIVGVDDEATVIASDDDAEATVIDDDDDHERATVSVVVGAAKATSIASASVVDAPANGRE